MDTVIAIFVGLGLAAACGLRVFLPLLVTSVSSHLGMIDLGPEFAWAGSTPAMIALGVAAAFEVGAYWVPWLDHALDLIAGPCAVIAGTLVAAAQFGEVEPLVKWASALIAGGGLAATVKATAMSIRAGSTATTAGIGNPVVSTVESLLAAAASVVAIIAPLIVGAVLGLVVLVVGAVVLRKIRRVRRARALKATTRENIPLARPATVHLSRAA